MAGKGRYVIAYKDGAVSDAEVLKAKRELSKIGVDSVWVKVLNRMLPVKEQIEVVNLPNSVLK